MPFKPYVEVLWGEMRDCFYGANRPSSAQNPQADLEANVAPLLNTLQEIRAQRFIYVSSGAVYDGLAI
jgi:nucleoside-diphosphate-sugar epimerase